MSGLDDQEEGLRLIKQVVEDHPESFAAMAAYSHALAWLTTLAAPRLFRSMTRVPPREHLLAQLDCFLAGPGSDWRGDARLVDEAQQQVLAGRLRTLVERWAPPELPEEITMTTRALLVASGGEAPEGDWDTFTYEGPETIEDILLWPEDPSVPPCK